MQRERLAQDPTSNLVKLEPQPSVLAYSSPAVGGRKQKQDGVGLVQQGKWCGGPRRQTQTILPPTPPAAHSLPFSRFLRTSFFRGIKEVQKGKLNNPNYRVEKKPISM